MGRNLNPNLFGGQDESKLFLSSPRYSSTNTRLPSKAIYFRFGKCRLQVIHREVLDISADVHGLQTRWSTAVALSVWQPKCFAHWHKLLVAAAQ